VLTLLRHPQPLARLRAGPALIGSAIEEVLRYEGSVNFLSRHPLAPYRIGGVTVQPEETIFFMLGAAHRDPAAFAHPDRFCGAWKSCTCETGRPRDREPAEAG
jgi:cytochrome P450